MGNRNGRRKFRWQVDLFNEANRIESGKWFDLEIGGEVTEAGEPIIRELHIIPKPEPGWPAPPPGFDVEALTKALLKEVVRIFDRVSEEAAAAVQMTTPDLSGVELELVRYLDGTSIRKKGDAFLLVDSEGNREIYEPRDEQEYGDLARALADSNRRRRISRQRWTNDELRQVADVYKEAVSQGVSAQAAIQERFFVSRSRASVLIGNARAAHLLPPATRGRKQAT